MFNDAAAAAGKARGGGGGHGGHGGTGPGPGSGGNPFNEPGPISQRRTQKANWRDRTTSRRDPVQSRGVASTSANAGEADRTVRAGGVVEDGTGGAGKGATVDVDVYAILDFEATCEDERIDGGR